MNKRYFGPTFSLRKCQLFPVSLDVKQIYRESCEESTFKVFLRICTKGYLLTVQRKGPTCLRHRIEGIDTVEVNWIRNPDGNWYLLDELTQVLPSMQCDGIYILWYFDESHVPQTVRVGIKGANDHLGMMRKDSEVEKYTIHPLYITWAEVKSPSSDDLIGIWSYLCEKLEPLAGGRCPQSDSIPVILPWAFD